MFDVADRLEILNLINLYSIYFDERSYDAWLQLFTDNATFEIPGHVLSGHDEILSINQTNEQLHAGGGQARHLMPNVAVIDQTATSATVAIHALIVTTEAWGQPGWELPARYDGQLVKTDGEWKIQRWKLHVDRIPN